jgi:polysaccharide export outer membrane protein
MELDELSIMVDKHDEQPKEVKVDWEGRIRYPLIGDVQVGGLTLEQVKSKVRDQFRDYVRDPSVEIRVVKKSPLARILVIGKGFQEYQGHEKVLDVLGADYETTWENVYDKVCVIRKKEDGSFYCILVDMEYMFKRYDFRQNIPLKAGDVILVKKMPPLFGYRFKYWWQQTLSWMNEVDEALNALKSIVDWRLKD